MAHFPSRINHNLVNHTPTEPTADTANTAEVKPFGLSEVLGESSVPAKDVFPAADTSGNAAEGAPARKQKKSKKKQVQAPRQRRSSGIGQKQHTSLYLSQSEHLALKMLCARSHLPMTDFTESACLDAMYGTHRCKDCGAEFITCRDENGEPVSARFCPACGGKQVELVYSV